METITGKVSDHLTVRKDLAIYGMATNGITVLSGTLYLYGMCNGDLAVTGSGSAQISGMVNGNVINDAQVTIGGVVNGKVYGPGKIEVSPDAKIRDGIDGLR